VSVKNKKLFKFFDPHREKVTLLLKYFNLVLNRFIIIELPKIKFFKTLFLKFK